MVGRGHLHGGVELVRMLWKSSGRYWIEVAGRLKVGAFDEVSWRIIQVGWHVGFKFSPGVFLFGLFLGKLPQAFLFLLYFIHNRLLFFVLSLSQKKVELFLTFLLFDFGVFVFEFDLFLNILATFWVVLFYSCLRDRLLALLSEIGML